MAQNSRSTKSIYDYIYLDDEKIAYLSSQVFEHGLLTGASLSDGKVSKNSTVTKGTANATGEGNLDKSVLSVLLGSAKVGGGTSLGLDYTVGSDLNSGLVHSYDTKFLAARNLLNKLDEDGYINKDLNDIQPCSLVLLQGNLEILDFDLFENLFFPYGKKQIVQFEKHLKPEIQENINHTKKLANQLKKQTNKEAEYQKILETLANLEDGYRDLEVNIQELKKSLPTSELAISSLKNMIRLKINTGNKVFSSLIKHEHLKFDLKSHAIKSGEKIEGVVFCLALVEQLPILDNVENSTMNDLQENNVGGVKFEYLNAALQEIRELLEIQLTDYRITPIMVFRKIV